MLIPLTQGAYTARSITADAQRCINLYPERNTKDSPTPFSHYPTPGLTSTGFTGPSSVRWQYTASNGNMYTVYGNRNGSSLYVSTPSTTKLGLGTTTLIGTFASVGSTPVCMADNGLVLLIVDGTTSAWALDLTNSANFGQVTDPNFLGAVKVDYLDTFFLFNVPNSNEWFTSLSEANYQMFTGVVGAILTGSITSSGATSYANGVYNNVAFTGGSGTGATGNFTVTSNGVTSVQVVNGGQQFLIGDVLSATLPGTSIATATLTTGGSGYTNGTYNNQSLTGGTGTGATANITVSGGAVTSVVLVSPGSGYLAGQTLSALVPGGTGFTYIVNTVQGTGFTFTTSTVAGTAFDSLDIVAKTGYPDPIVALIVMDLYIWILGTQTTEIWFNAGAADFTFQIFPGVFIEHGCAAAYSVAKQDLSIYWISQDKQGQCIVLKGNNFSAHRISTFAIEYELSQYSKISDAVGWTYQQQGHVFYVLYFPTADKTWVWDESSQLWHQRCSLQTIQSNSLTVDGNLHAAIYTTGAVCNGLVYVNDGLGNQYLLDQNNYTENTVPIPRIRSFPHSVKDMQRVHYKRFIADMEPGTDDPTVTGDGTSSTSPPQVNLRWSDNRGRTYGNYVPQSLGALGKYLTTTQWWRLGYARDRVFELSWSVPTSTALNGAWIEVEPMGT